MSITDELRKYASSLGTLVYASTANVKRALEGIADRIDQQHEECAGFCRRLEDAASKGEEVTLFGTDYVPLPTDAEGIPFHVGDHVEVPDGLPSEGKPWQVGTIARLDLGATCWHVRVIAGGMYHDYLIENVRHHHKPTVEDVLREMVAAYMDTPLDDSNNGEFFAEYAAKLRLVGEDA